MADTEDLLEFFEGGIGVLFNMGAELLRVELAPDAPTRFRWQGALLGSDQIPVNRTPGQSKMPGGFHFGTAALNEFDHPLPQVQRIGFHARKPISLCPNVYMKCYSFARERCRLRTRHRAAPAGNFSQMVNQEAVEELFQLADLRFAEFETGQRGPIFFG